MIVVLATSLRSNNIGCHCVVIVYPQYSTMYFRPVGIFCGPHNRQAFYQTVCRSEEVRVMVRMRIIATGHCALNAHVVDRAGHLCSRFKVRLRII